MDHEYLSELHADLCRRSIELSRRVMAMDTDNEHYHRMNELAQRLDAARAYAFSLLTMSLHR